MFFVDVQLLRVVFSHTQEAIICFYVAQDIVSQEFAEDWDKSQALSFDKVASDVPIKPSDEKHSWVN